MKIYGYFRSSAAFRLRIAMNLKGLSYDHNLINLQAGDHLSDSFRLINPQGRVPVLDIEGDILTQSLAIIEYLEEVYPAPALLPQDALEKAKVLGHKTGKDKEWSAQADEEYINAVNELALAKACRKWFENKISYFSGWHYAFKSFMKRDYSIENATSLNISRYNESSAKKVEPYPSKNEKNNDEEWGEIDWG